MAAARVIVFIDYQNMYRGAREAHGWDHEQGYIGNFRPLKMGELLAGGDGREFKQVRVYTGVPTAHKDGVGHAIMQRRIEGWKAEDPGCVEVLHRALKYPPPEGREKGIDVQLAIDLVRLCIEDEYDVAVLASADTDLAPALEFILDHSTKAVETVAWKASPQAISDVAAPLDIAGHNVRRRLMSRDHFDHVVDTTNYFKQASAPKKSFAGKTPDYKEDQGGRRPFGR